MSHVFHFGAKGDGQTDDTEAILHALQNGDGPVTFGRGIYRISHTLEVPLNDLDRIGIDGSNGTAKLLMAGPGPAIRLKGTHDRSADPTGFKPEVWRRQRMPQIVNIEIEGAHPEADGIELIGTMQAIISGVLLRELRHGVRLVQRNRNVLISDCQIYHNTGVGVFCENVNLHQFNITGNHISYNRLGGIRIEGSEVRNLQITGNDIEYNNYRSHSGAKPDEVTAEILIDSRGVPTDQPRPSVRELTIASNTIQSTYSPNGANIRIIGPDPTGNLPPGMAAISGNLVGNQSINVHLTACRGISISGNFIYAGDQHNLRLENCDDMSIGSNTFGHNYWVEDQEINNNVSLIDCSDCAINGVEIRGAPSGSTTFRTADDGEQRPRAHEALFELTRCARVNLMGCVLRDPTPVGIVLRDCSLVNITGCQIHDTREPKQMSAAVQWKGKGQSNLMANNLLSRGLRTAVDVDAGVGVKQDNNIEV